MKLTVSPATLAANPELADVLQTQPTRRTATYAASEASEQMALIEWVLMAQGQEPRLRLLFHVPNGELRDKATGEKLQRMGVKPGIPDLLLPVVSRGYHGFAIELKRKGGELSPEQVEWLDRFRDQGWFANVYVGWVSAACAMCWYLERKPEELGLASVVKE